MQVIYFEEKFKPFVVMEYCSLGNLEHLQDVEPEQYVSASRQILVGLRHLHSNWVAHRDLKPANLLVVNRHPFHIKSLILACHKLSQGTVFLEPFLEHVCIPRPRFILPTGQVIGPRWTYGRQASLC